MYSALEIIFHHGYIWKAGLDACYRQHQVQRWCTTQRWLVVNTMHWQWFVAAIAMLHPERGCCSVNMLQCYTVCYKQRHVPAVTKVPFWLGNCVAAWKGVHMDLSNSFLKQTNICVTTLLVMMSYGGKIHFDHIHIWSTCYTVHVVRIIFWKSEGGSRAL